MRSSWLFQEVFSKVRVTISKQLGRKFWRRQNPGAFSRSVCCPADGSHVWDGREGKHLQHHTGKPDQRASANPPMVTPFQPQPEGAGPYAIKPCERWWSTAWLRHTNPSETNLPWKTLSPSTVLPVLGQAIICRLCALAVLDVPPVSFLSHIELGSA